MVLGGVVIFVACILLALWFYSSTQRAAKIHDIQAAADAEKAALIVDNAERAALAERELNDYLA